MYTIIMNDDKSLVTSVRKTIYQGENMADKIQFLFPEYYEDINLSECSAVLKYIDQGNIFHSESLAKDSELYKGKVRCMLPIDSKLTQFAGNIIVRISFFKADENAIVQELLKTGSTIVTISPDDAIGYTTDVSEKMLALQTKVNENKALIDELKASKADDISYIDNKLQLLANEQGIGKSVEIASGTGSGADTEDGVPVVDFGESKENNSTDESESTDAPTNDDDYPVVEF